MVMLREQGPVVHNVAQIRAAIGESAEGGQPGENERQRAQSGKRPARMDASMRAIDAVPPPVRRREYLIELRISPPCVFCRAGISDCTGGIVAALLGLFWRLLREGQRRGVSWQPEIGMEHASRGRRSGNKGALARDRRGIVRTKVSHSGMTPGGASHAAAKRHCGAVGFVLEVVAGGGLKVARGRSWQPDWHGACLRGRRSGNKGVGARWRGRFRIFSARHCSRTKVSHAENSGMTMLFARRRSPILSLRRRLLREGRLKVARGTWRGGRNSRTI